jgi:hypothetical protein
MTSSASAAGANAKAQTMSKDDGTDGTPSSPTSSSTATADRSACRPEHGFHAFDALYCALTRATPIKPLFPDDK